MMFGYYYNMALSDKMNVREAAEFALTQTLNASTYGDVVPVKTTDFNALLAIVPLAFDYRDLTRIAGIYDMGVNAQSARSDRYDGFVSNVEHLAAQIDKAGFEMLKSDLPRE